METGIHELTAGYALDALDQDERSAYEAHLSGCEQCQQELASFWTTTEALAVAASGPEPSPALTTKSIPRAGAWKPLWTKRQGLTIWRRCRRSRPCCKRRSRAGASPSR